jgi:TRAP-type C4-dicarboxylate transport system substrate-binding protein
MFKDKKVNYPSDFKGMKISSTGTVIADLQKMGITPVTMPPGDLYEALQRGTVDGLMRGTIDSFYTNKWYEVAKYILYPQFGASICNVTFNMNLDKWNSLPKDVQDVMMKLAPAYQDLNMKLIMEMEIKQTKDMVAKGCEAYKLTPDALKQWKDIFVPAHADDYIAAIAKKGVTNGREVFNKMIETAKTYEKSPKWLEPF